MQSGRGAEALGIYEANLTVSKIGEYFIYAVFIFGFALLGLSDSAWKFSQTWMWLSVVLYIVGIGLSHGVVMPTVKRMGVLMREVLAGPAAHRWPAAAGRGDGAPRPEAGRGRPGPGPDPDRDPLPHGVEAGHLSRAEGHRAGTAPYDDLVHPVLGSFYDEVLRELIAAMGAALFFGNLYALLRRGRDADRVSARTVERGRPGSPVRRPPSPRRAGSWRRRRSAGPSASWCSGSS